MACRSCCRKTPASWKPKTRRQSINPRHFWIAGGLLGVVIAGFVITDLVLTRQKNVAEAQAWSVDGPPCPVTTRAEFEAQGFRVRKRTDYEGVLMGRQAGNVECNVVANKGGTGFGTVQTCQFTAPAVLTVTMDGAETAYLIGPGQPATLVMRKTKVQCVLGGPKYIGQR